MEYKIINTETTNKEHAQQTQRETVLTYFCQTLHGDIAEHRHIKELKTEKNVWLYQTLHTQ